MVYLGQAGGQLAAAGTGSGDHHQRLGGLDVGVGAVALVAADVGDVGGIALDGAMDVVLHAPAGELAGEGVGGGLAGVAGDDHAVHRDAHGGDVVDETQHLHVVADAQVCPDLGLFDVVGRDAEDDLGILAHFVQQPDLAVDVKAGQNPGCMVVVEQLAAELQIQLAAELGDALLNMLLLQLDVFGVIKTRFQSKSPFLQMQCRQIRPRRGPFCRHRTKNNRDGRRPDVPGRRRRPPISTQI